MRFLAPFRHKPLVSFDTDTLPTTEVDILVIGSGSAALRAAIEASKHARVLIVTKRARTESNSLYAQGGIAAAMSEEDTPAAHIRDTLKVGCGLADPRIVRLVVDEGRECIRELLMWGASFDRIGHRLDFTREGGHSLPRVLHKGDETGAELENTLLGVVQNRRNIKLVEYAFVIDLLVAHAGKKPFCGGAIIHTPEFYLEAILAKKTILAAGGIGQTYRETTNPPIATGDGIAMAFRAGAKLQDMEFVQFHPTTLYLAGASRALISEAVRGAGGRLVDKNGYAFMKEYHPMGDLAPRDVVSRAILQQMEKTHDSQVYLELTHLPARKIEESFPGLWRLCQQFHLDLTREPIPIRPSAHYLVGGVKTDEWGRTTVQNLYACGEVACTGFHGANRLASNSLLECLVFGKRAGAHAAHRLGMLTHRHFSVHRKTATRRTIDIEDMKNSIKSLLWRRVGVNRDTRGLSEVLHKLRFWASYVLEAEFDMPEGWELQNMLTVALLIATAALQRHESRGVHFRTDFPQPDKRYEKRHLVL